jgi:hypothetical protein
MFYYADGFRFLKNPEEVSNSALKDCKVFLFELYNKLINLEFKSQNISYNPEFISVVSYRPFALFINQNSS